MLTIILCLEIYLRCIKIALIAIMEESAQYYATWALLRPHADPVTKCKGAGQFITSHLQRRGLRLIAYPLPLRRFFTHTQNQMHLQTLLVEFPSPKVGVQGERPQKAE